MKSGESFFARWRANFFTGLAVLLPGALSIALVVWLFKNVASVTDTLLVFLPKTWTHENQGQGPLHWYYSLLALGLSILLITVIGRLTRIYVGQQVIKTIEEVMMRIPLINKIYGTIKQVNEAFTSGNKTAFKQVVMFPYPRAGLYSIGFLTSDQVRAVIPVQQPKLLCVFIPTTPNPTSGFIVLVPEHEVTVLDMSIADGIKFIISLGALGPEQQQATLQKNLPPSTQAPAA